MALKEQSLVYTRIILGLSGCLLAAGVVYLIRRRRRHLKEQEEHRRQLNELLTSQQELNRRNETLSRELEQVSHNEIIDLSLIHILLLPLVSLSPTTPPA